MERIKNPIVFNALEEGQLVDLYSLESFSSRKDQILEELRRRAKNTNLSPRAFIIVFPDYREIKTGMGIGGFIDADGNQRVVPLRRLVAFNEEDHEVRSTDYI